MKKEILNSIHKTAQWLKHDFKAFDYAFFMEQVVNGLRKDIPNKEATVEGEWLHAQDSKGHYYEINIYQQFQAI